MRTFGPWSQLFQYIYLNLEDSLAVIKPFLYFHGRVLRSQIELLLGKKYFLIRYSLKGGILLNWLMDNFPKQAKITRKFVKGNAVWIYKERVPSIRCVKTVTNKFTTIDKWIEYMKFRFPEDLEVPLCY